MALVVPFLQIYGCSQIVLEKEETEELKRFDDPGLILIGFKPLMMLKKHHYLRPSLFVYPEESLINGKGHGPWVNEEVM